jgi:adhesin transport system membrane fusion protein
VSILSFWRRDATALRPGDLAMVSAMRAAHVVEPAPAAMWSVYLMLLAVVVAAVWATVARVDIIATAPAHVIPDGREQVIASLEGGILRELRVREGERVTAGQELALLDPTRLESSRAEGQTRRLALRATVARLTAEATGQALAFPAEVQAQHAVVAAETASYQSRMRAQGEAEASIRRSIELVERELAVAEGMSAKGLMSEVEVMRLRRQVNDLQLQLQERINRFRQDANAELVRNRNDLALLDEQMVVRDDAVRRTTLRSPVDGIVKQIRANTVGGVVAPGSPVMEIVPSGPQVLLEARIKPTDIAFVKVGQLARVKLSAYDVSLYGSLSGTVLSISPDALGDADKAATGGTYYRAIVRTDVTPLEKKRGPMPVVPGMNGLAEIRTGERSVMMFLFRPLVRTAEAFRER